MKHFGGGGWRIQNGALGKGKTQNILKEGNWIRKGY